MNTNKSLFQVNEISIVYKNQIPTDKKIKIISSRDIYNLMKPVFDDFMCHHEEMWLVLLNHANCVIGISKISQGGITETVVDPRIIFQVALKANATGIILVHNHPSNNLDPSNPDKQITRKVVSSANLMDMKVLDHLIIADGGYLSFADEGIL